MNLLAFSYSNLWFIHHLILLAKWLIIPLDYYTKK